MAWAITSSPKHAAITGCATLGTALVFALIGDRLAIPEPWNTIGFIVMLAAVAVGAHLIGRAENGLAKASWTRWVQAALNVGLILWIGQHWLGAGWGGDKILGKVGGTLFATAGALWVLSVLVRAVSAPKPTDYHENRQEP